MLILILGTLISGTRDCLLVAIAQHKRVSFENYSHRQILSFAIDMYACMFSICHLNSII